MSSDDQMTFDVTKVTFRPLTKADVPLLHRWINSIRLSLVRVRCRLARETLARVLRLGASGELEFSQVALRSTAEPPLIARVCPNEVAEETRMAAPVGAIVHTSHEGQSVTEVALDGKRNRNVTFCRDLTWRRFPDPIVAVAYLRKLATREGSR